MTEFQYVVVGAGSAGCVLAARLTEDPATRVLLLEAGGAAGRREVRIPAAFSKLFGSDADWCYSTAPQDALDGREVYFPRGKMLGGSSSLNAQIVGRGYREDYDGWGADGWCWDDVGPYFDRATSGPFETTELRDRAALTSAFLDAAGAVGVDAEAVRVTQRRGRRWSVADAYLRPALRRRNLTVVTGAHASRVVVERGRAVSVVHGDNEAHATREVIVAGGAINSPQLLLLSGIGPRDELERVGVELLHELPGVGRNLQDHVTGGIQLAVTSRDTLFAAESRRSIARYLLFRRGMLTSNVAEAVAFVRTRSDLPAPDLELLFAPVLFVDGGLAPPPEHGVTIAAIVLQPQSAGYVGLRSADPFDPPVIDPRYLSDDADLRTMVDGVRLARRIAAEAPLARHVREELLPGTDAQSDEALAAAARANAQTLYHPVGTCAIGSVVDVDLRVRGLDGLRVVDASVMPRVPRGHTNLPTVMIAEKASDLIRSSDTPRARVRSRAPARGAA